jgi:polyisoprenoid-binding protein YceI
MITAIIAGVAGTAFAADDRYAIDPTHTYPSFEFSHLGISVWRGKFTKTSGDIHIDRTAKTGTVDIAVATSSIDFGLDAMDDKARSDDFFNSAKFPVATYQGALRFAGDAPKAIDGQITLLGVTRPLTLAINSFNCIPHPVLKKELCGADVEADLNWAQFGMKMSRYGEGDAGKVHLRIQVEALRQN